MTPLSRFTKVLIPIVLIILSSCAHNFERMSVQEKDEAVCQELRVRIKNKDEQDKFTVYTQINRTKKQAILDGVGTAGKHIFTLKADNKQYELVDYLNDKTESGNLNEFELIPLDEKTLFTSIDLKEKQPIVIISKDGNVRVEITVKEQKPIK